MLYSKLVAESRQNFEDDKLKSSVLMYFYHACGKLGGKRRRTAGFVFLPVLHVPEDEICLVTSTLRLSIFQVPALCLDIGEKSEEQRKR